MSNAYQIDEEESERLQKEKSDTLREVNQMYYGQSDVNKNGSMKESESQQDIINIGSRADSSRKMNDS